MVYDEHSEKTIGAVEELRDYVRQNESTMVREGRSVREKLRALEVHIPLCS
jgi:hypothetical protein